MTYWSPISTGTLSLWFRDSKKENIKYMQKGTTGRYDIFWQKWEQECFLAVTVTVSNSNSFLVNGLFIFYQPQTYYFWMFFVCIIWPYHRIIRNSNLFYVNNQWTFKNVNRRWFYLSIVNCLFFLGSTALVSSTSFLHSLQSFPSQSP